CGDLSLFVYDTTSRSVYFLRDKTTGENISLDKKAAETVAYDILTWMIRDVKLINPEQLTKEIEKRGKKISDFDKNELEGLKTVLDIYGQSVHSQWECGSKSDSTTTYEIEWSPKGKTGKEDFVRLTVKKDGKRRYSFVSQYNPSDNTRRFIYTGEVSSRTIPEQEANTALRNVLKDMKK
ncbi:MAG: hypothetical protein Q8O03_09335, partial [Nanoarchaeota archaeon]|nr:hypothetical protein [Nanoarchaeota archaeon]